jgi:hypothetical protein
MNRKNTRALHRVLCTLLIQSALLTRVLVSHVARIIGFVGPWAHRPNDAGQTTRPHLHRPLTARKGPPRTPSASCPYGAPKWATAQLVLLIMFFIFPLLFCNLWLKLNFQKMFKIEISKKIKIEKIQKL